MDTFKKVAFLNTPTYRMILSDFKKNQEIGQARLFQNIGGQAGGDFCGSAIRQWLVEKTGAGSEKRPVVRPISTWKIPTAATERELLESFTRHVFVKYPMPRWFFKVWETKNLASGEATEWMFSEPVKYKNLDTTLWVCNILKIKTCTSVEAKNWFVQVAQGKNLSTLVDLPIVLTKKMAHHALLAPGHFTLVQAFRWGQVLGLGGGVPLARAVCRSFLGKIFKEKTAENFWLAQLNVLARQPHLSEETLATLLEFTRRVRSENHAFGNRTWLEPDENFSLSNVEEWEKFWLDVRRVRFKKDFEPKIEIDTEPYLPGLNTRRQRKRFQKKENLKFQQLKTHEEFVAEGQEMRHCVATYFSIFQENGCAIWSVRPKRGKSPTAAGRLTIEIRHRKIWQIKGFRNRSASDEEMEIVKFWARKMRVGSGV